MTPERSIPQEARQPIHETLDSISYLGVRLPKAQNINSPFVPQREKYADYINDSELSLPMQQAIAVNFQAGDPMLIEGGTSLGKTTTVRKMASELGWEVLYVNLNGSSDVEDLMGRYIPNPNRKGPEDPEYIFADGKVTSGLRREEGKKKIIILDEFSSANPNIVIRLHEVVDALERNGSVVLSEDASESVQVSKEDTKIIALINPPGKGYLDRQPIDPAQLRRWVYYKAPTDLPDQTFTYATEALFGLAPLTVPAMPEQVYLTSRDAALLPEELKEIPGLLEIVKRYEEFHWAAKSLVKERKVAADQPQPFTFDDRMEPRRVLNFVQRFYNGDINETFQRALRYYYSNKLATPEDKAKLEEAIVHVQYQEQQGSSHRQPLTTPGASAPDTTPRTEGARVTWEEARRIMGNDFIGEAELQNTFGGAIEHFGSLKDILRAPFPFSQAELERHKELGGFVIIRPNRLPGGRGADATMSWENERLQSKFNRDSRGKVLYDIDWYKDEDFFKREIMKAKVALVSKDVIPGTTSKNYLEQTEVVADFLTNKAFRGLALPTEYQEAIREFVRQKPEIERLMADNWLEAAKRLAGLKLNQMTRQTAGEAIFDDAVYFDNKGEKLMEGKYTWTKSQAQVGHLVFVGRFGADGADVTSRSRTTRIRV